MPAKKAVCFEQAVLDATVQPTASNSTVIAETLQLSQEDSLMKQPALTVEDQTVMPNFYKMQPYLQLDFELFEGLVFAVCLGTDDVLKRLMDDLWDVLVLLEKQPSALLEQT